MKKLFVRTFLALMLLALVVVESTVAEPFKIKMGSTSVRSGLYAVTVAIAETVNKTYPGQIEITVAETGGYIENLSRIGKKSGNHSA